MADDLAPLFVGLGLDEVKAREAAKNKKLSVTLKEIIEEANQPAFEKAVGLMLYQLATKFPAESPLALKHRKTIIEYIVRRDIKSELQLTAALAYAKITHEFDKDKFEETCGVGVVVSAAEIQAGVDELIGANKQELLQERYYFSSATLLKQLREKFKWGDGKLIKDLLDKSIETLLGPKTEEDLKPRPKEKKAKVESKKDDIEAAPASETRTFAGEVLKFHKPGENPQLNPEIMRKHLEATGGRVMTRFPPEPNGYLHIGHAKAINFNFTYAENNNGLCYLRYDDTNPEAEEKEFFDSIKETVEWLGFHPWKVTHSSDYFDQLYEYAIQLIKRDKAYVCHMTPEEVHQSRGGDNKGPRFDSPWRNRPIEESLQAFEDMRKGKYKSSEATLRMKINMQSGNPYLWDPIAYRVLYSNHVKSGDKWCIYPTYDFTHPLCDSMENITHSLCTTEFILARESYYWLCDALEVYRPVQWEYGRLQITNTVLSKRKLTKLVKNGIVAGWDDPRLHTLVGLRRRGFTPKAINSFVERVGITTNIVRVSYKMLESFVRDDLNLITDRVSVVLEPLKVVITNWPEEKIEEIDTPNLPTDPSRGSHLVPFGRVLYIERSDFRETPDSNFFRLSPGGTVGLQKAYSIRCESVQRDAAGNIQELHVVADLERTWPKPKAYVHWVAHAPSHGSPVLIREVRLINHLFLHENPDDETAVPGGWLSDINPNAMVTVKGAIGEVALRNAKAGDRFQFLRSGFFVVDQDSTPLQLDKPADESGLVFVRTVTLKEDSGKE